MQHKTQKTIEDSEQIGRGHLYWKENFLFTEGPGRLPSCSGLSLCYCRQISAAVSKGSISLNSVVAPACLALRSLLRTTPVPFYSSAGQEAAWIFHSRILIYGINKTSPKQINHDVSGETMQLIPDSLKNMTRVGSDWREQCVLRHISWI